MREGWKVRPIHVVKIDISFDSKNGLAYIATNKGVSIIRIPYSDEKKSYQYVEIFPSPFIIPNNKPLTINGLRDNSEIKIMTLNGIVIKTIYQSEVKGYQAYSVSYTHLTLPTKA